MTKKQRSVFIGLILGDGYLQKTGKQNARLRLEHSLKQKEYMAWKVILLKNYFQAKIQTLERTNSSWGKTYSYVRIQSMSSSEIGKFQRIFYKDSKKIIPVTINKLLNNSLSLAVWFMDDGYYYHRDKMSYIYIPNYDKESIQFLLKALQDNFNLMPILKAKKKGLVLIFNVVETQKLMKLISKDIIPSMRYKISLDPVSTDQNLI